MAYYHNNIIDAELAWEGNVVTEAGLSLRFVNFLIDYLSIYCIATIVGVLVGYINSIEYLFFNSSQYSPFLDYVIFTSTLLVYFSTEYLFNGKSFGKFLTRTTVRHRLHSEITFNTYLLRTLWRLIPLEAISFIPGLGERWHDQFSDTYVTLD